MTRPRHVTAFVALALLAAAVIPTAAQDGPVSGSSVGGVRSGRTLSEDSRPVGAGSRSMREGSAGSMHSPSVRSSSRGTMRSGPVSEASVGSARSGGTLTGSSDSIGESSVGAVKKDLSAPLGERISESLTDMEGLQEQLRAVQPVPRLTPLPSEQEAAEAEAQARAEEEQQAAEEEAQQPEQGDQESESPREPEPPPDESQPEAPPAQNEAPTPEPEQPR